MAMTLVFDNTELVGSSFKSQKFQHVFAIVSRFSHFFSRILVLFNQQWPFIKEFISFTPRVFTLEFKTRTFTRFNKSFLLSRAEQHLIYCFVNSIKLYCVRVVLVLSIIRSGQVKNYIFIFKQSLKVLTYK